MKRVVNAVVRIEYEQDDNSYYADGFRTVVG